MLTIGERVAAAITKAVTPLITSKYVKSIGLENKKKQIMLKDFQELEPKLIHVILATAKKAVPPLWKALSVTFKDRLIFGFMKITDEELLKQIEKSLDKPKFPVSPTLRYGCLFLSTFRSLTLLMFT
jgi:hypothetical protein